MAVNESPNLRVALVGFGLAGAVFHAPLIAGTPNMVLAAIVTKDSARREKAAAEYPKAALLTEASEVFEHPELYDLVVIASPNNTHYHLAKAALQAGLAVVVDKPMATTYKECLELIRLSEQQGRVLSVFQNRRWDGDLLTVKQLIDSGQLGTVTRFESRFERWRPQLRPGHWRESGGPEDAGGLLYDLGSHLIDQALHLFGTPTRIYAEVDIRREEARVDDDIFIALSFENDVRAHLWASAVACSGGPRFHIYGMKGTYTKFGLDPQEDALRAGTKPTDKNWGAESPDAWGTLFTGDGQTVQNRKIETLPGSYNQFYVQMHAAITRGAPAPVDPHEAAQVLRVVESARRAASECEPVCI